MANELLSQNQQFSGLPLEDLIGGPLNAEAKANASMSFVQTKFIMDTCFETVENEDVNKNVTYKPKMITMVLERSFMDYDKKSGETVLNKVTTTFNLPLLTIIPIKCLAVKSMDVGFEMEVKSCCPETKHDESMSDTQGEGKVEGKLGW